ncbi:formin-binding protein 4 isoform X2 [Orussus abietinus]|uniref:formin-binding protein 4 isoform X2 n=1 Tax=Orussus abietinus TaxID=222816 RepID=UPI0006263539|nr:formin-binding protein 4 isoform X2 [Orussus abietinus]
MKRRQRKPVLDINGEESESCRRRWQNKYQQIAVDHPEHNGASANPLANLLGHYDSDSEADDAKDNPNKLNDKVNDFLKEIQLIAPEPLKSASSTKSHAIAVQSGNHATQQQILWQECYDETTGYPYYWHTETNEVTWEMPSEMRLLRDGVQQDPALRSSHVTQWPHISTSSYSEAQTDIPEGMIPKEVVARNRNRLSGVPQSSFQKVKTNEEVLETSDPKGEDSDDGKIEMITSFGNDESESDTSDNESLVKETSKQGVSSKSHLQKHSVTNLSSSGKSEDGCRNSRIGPVFLSASINVDERNEDVENKCRADEDINSSKNPDVRSGTTMLITGKEYARVQNKSYIDEKDVLMKLKSQGRTVHSVSGRQSECTESSVLDEKSSQMEKDTQLNRSEESHNMQQESGRNITTMEMHRKSLTFDKDTKISLVPGYGDDSDGDDEISVKKSTVKPLFPISEYQANQSLVLPQNTTKDSLGTSTDNVRKVETKQLQGGSVKIFEYHNDNVLKDKENDLSKKLTQRNENVEVENKDKEEIRIVRVELEPPKPNIFLENLEAPAKAFQRKKRIAFDVVVGKNKTTEAPATSAPKPDSENAQPLVPINDPDHQNTGFQKESSVEYSEPLDQNAEASEKPVNATKNGINFVKGETLNMPEENTSKAKEKVESSKEDLKPLVETITEKLRFLCEGSQMASAVQVMGIQLQTLLTAWEAGDLKESYLSNWLTGTSGELARLEQAAAPPGWDCQWDRSHKRYYYRNATSGEAQWTYPELDVIGGTEEMDLCTTPPPPDQEEASIIENEGIETPEPKQDSTSRESASEEKPSVASEEQEEKNETSCIEVRIPPPPKISSPSPPPPPRIFAEDLRRGRKRRGSEKNHGNRRREKLAKGVDPPDMPYTLAASALESNLLYTATSQQTNPIYAATIGNPGLPLLNHHTALMQGQLMHYPAYHQHLHNQAILAAAANRLTGQEAVRFMVADYTQMYASSQVIAKPPIKMQRESLGSALNSFYSDIASIEKTKNEQDKEQETLASEAVPSPVQQVQTEITEQSNLPTETVIKEKKRKKAKIGSSKKHKEMSSMVAKWQKVQQNFEDNS